MPQPHVVRDRAWAYGFAAIDDRGRIAARAVLQCLGWEPETRLTIAEQAGLVVIRAEHEGASRVTPQGHLRIPVPIRQWCGLTAGAQVLLVAEPDQRRLVIHPAASLDAMISRRYAEVFGGAP